MKHLLITCILLLAVVTAFAQDKTVKELQEQSNKTIKKDPTDTLVKTWKKGGQFSLNLSQASLSNWAAGGDNFAMSINTYLNLFAYYQRGKHSWDNNLDMNFGYVNTTSLGSRKNDDRIDLLSKYGYAVHSKLNVSGLFNFRSQMLKGYTYDDDNKSLASDFLAPAYVLLSLGLDYHPVKNLSLFVSPFTSRWTLVKNDSLAARGLYGVDSGRNSKNELGAYLTVNYSTNINNNVTYKGRLDLFSNYKSRPQNVDLFMSNLFAVKISRILSATWSLDLIYDDDTKLFGKNNNSPALQVKSVVGAGVLVKF